MKKKFILLVIIFTSINSLSQQKAIKYTDSIGNEASITNYFNKKIFSKQDSCRCYVLEVFKKNDVLESTMTYKDSDGKIRHGLFKSYYPNGNIDFYFTYRNDSLVGPSKKWYENGAIKEIGYYSLVNTIPTKKYQLTSYWNIDGIQTVVNGNGNYSESNDVHEESGSYLNSYKNGIWKGKFLKKEFTYEEIYENGELIKGTSYINGEKINYTSLEVKPEPKKGVEHFYNYIAKNFEPTRAAEKAKIKGSIILQFTVTKDGDITSIKVKKSMGYGLDEEAIRVLESYPKWKPGLQRGIPVNCSYLIPIKLDFSSL